MPIPGSVLNSMFPRGIASAVSPVPGNTLVFPSLGTLRPLVKTDDTTGQEIHTYSDSTDPAQQNLPCRLSPLIQVRPQNQENQETGGIQRSEAKFQINFSAYINVLESTLVQWQVKVDGLIYQIKSAERDGQTLMTRLMVSDPLPYNP